MQDNYPNIDKQFTDRGWAAMEELLDRELPTDVPKKKRRRWMIFLLFFGLGIGIAIGVVAGGLYYLDLEGEEVQAVVGKPIVEEAVIPATFEEKSLEAAVNEVGENENTDKETNEKTDALKNPNSILNSPSDQSTDKLENNNKVKASKNIDYVQNIKEKRDAVLENGDEGIVKIEETLTNNLSNNQQNVQDETNEINALISKGIGLFDVEVEVPKLALGELELPNQEPKEKTVNIGRFGVEIGGQGAPNFAGLMGGFFYTQPFNDKWSIQTGLNYAYQRRIFSGTPLDISSALTTGGGGNNFNTLDDLIEGTYDQNFNIPNGEEAVFAIPENLSFHYLNLPLKLNYQINEKWSLGAGASAALLLYAGNTYTDGGLLNANAKGSLLNADETAAPQGSIRTVAKANLQNYDLSAIGGITFHPSSNWSVTAQYNHGFINLFKYSSDKKYNRYAQLGIQYHFGK